jgi:hypothetical protein
MGPVVPELLVGNGYNHENQVDYVDHTLVDTKPEKNNKGVNGSISDSYKKLVSGKQKTSC